MLALDLDLYLFLFTYTIGIETKGKPKKFTLLMPHQSYYEGEGAIKLNIGISLNSCVQIDSFRARKTDKNGNDKYGETFVGG